jgi:hypothetical protein
MIKIIRNKLEYIELNVFLLQKIDLAPGLYETQKYQTIHAPVEASRLINP